MMKRWKEEKIKEHERGRGNGIKEEEGKMKAESLLFLFNLEFFLYDHDQIFITRINLDISDGFDKIQQQEQDIVLE